jgi:two-component system, sporulation sensor kinase D
MYVSYYQYKKMNEADARIAADLYKDHLDRFVGEAVSGLEMLAMVVNAADKNTEEIKKY